jgi:hypothetical protein
MDGKQKGSQPSPLLHQRDLSFLFSRFHFENFRDRLRDLRMHMIGCNCQASLEHDTLENDKKITEKKSTITMANGEP